MTTTACDDQFTAEPEPVIQALEIGESLCASEAEQVLAGEVRELRDQIAYALSGVFSALDEATARAERAEAQLKAAREPIYFFRQHGVQTSWLECSDSKQAVQLRDLGFQVRALYAAPIPAPAAQAPQGATCKKPLQVPNEWREVLSGLIALVEKKGKKQGSPSHSHRRTNIWDDDTVLGLGTFVLAANSPMAISC